MDPPYSATDWLTLMYFPSSNQSHSWSLTFRRCRQLSICQTECICICCKWWCSSLNGDYRMRLLFCIFFREAAVFFLREAFVAIAMKIVSYVIATLVLYPLQKCSSVSTLTFVSHISKLWHEVDLRTVQPTSKAYCLMYSNISIT